MPSEGVRLFEELMRFRPDGLTANAWAVKAGVSRTIWADLRRHGNPSRRTLEKLLGAAGSSLAEFEALRVGQATPVRVAGNGFADPNRGWRGATLPPIPLFATQLAGEWELPGSEIAVHALELSRTVGGVDRPRSLATDADAYAVAMAGNAMWPRFRAGRRLLVSPAAPIEIGDDVLAELTDSRVLIKELVTLSASRIGLRQFNPDVTFEVQRSEVGAILKVVGEAI